MSEHEAARPRAWLTAVGRTFDPRTRQGQLAIASAVVLLVALVVALLLTRSDVRPTAAPPVPPSVSAGPGTSAPSSSASKSAAAKKKPFACSSRRATAFGGSAPTRICVPGIRVDAAVMELGLNRDRTVQVPPLSRVQDAGWYKNSAVPGAVGPTVVLGHVDSAQFGEGVFFDLARLHRGDRVVVTRGDGKVATYRVDRLQQVSKSAFPSQEVYGATSGPAIRLVTCGGRFNASTGSYVDNIIAYGTLQSLRSR